MFNNVYSNGFVREALKKEPELYLYYIQLLSYRNNDTKLCCPSIELLAEDLEVSKNTIEKWNTKLKKMGVIKWKQTQDSDFHKYRRYFFPMETAEYKMKKIIESGYTDLRTIIKHFNIDVSTLRLFGFKVDTDSRKVVYPLD